MKRFARFAVKCSLVAVLASPLLALDPARHEDPEHEQDQKEEQAKPSARDRKAAKGRGSRHAKAEPKQPVASEDAPDRVDRLRSRMKERDREMDRLLNKRKKR